MDSSDTTVLVSTITASIAAIGAGAAIWTLRLQRQANTLAERREQSAEPSIDLSIQDATTRVIDNGNFRIWDFTIQVTNESDRSNSIVQAGLQITYRSADAPDYTYVASVNKVHAEAEDSASILDIPLSLGARDSIVGTFHFEAPTVIFEGKELLRHLITITDAYGESTQIEPVAIRKTGGEND